MAAALPIGRAWWITIAATLTMSVSYIDRQALAALAPTVTEKLHISDAAYGWLQSAFSIAYLVGSPLAGMWIDRAGARRGLVVSMCIWTVIAALHAGVPGFATLFALRIALGLAESPGFPGAAQSVQRVLPPAHRSAGFGVLFTGSSLGAAIAAPLAVALQNRYGWRAAFVLTAVAGIAWIPLWLGVTRARSARLALDRREARPDASTRTPIAPLLREPAVQRALALVFLSAPFIAFALLWGAKYLRAAFHMPQANVGHYLWLPPLCFDVGSVVFGAIATRRDRIDHAAGRSRTQHGALIATATLLFLAGVAATSMTTPWGFIGVTGIACGGGGALYALLTADMLARVPAHAVSTAGGLTAASQSLAYIVTNIALGTMVQRTHSYHASVVVLALAVIPAVVFWLTRNVRAAEGVQQPSNT